MSDAVPTNELPAAIRVPLHSLQADIDYLFARLIADKDCAPVMAESVKQRLANLEAAIRDAILPDSAKNETGIEPVAWQFHHEHLVPNDRWRFAEAKPKGRPWCDFQPLYSAAQLAEITRQLDEALAKVAELVARNG